MPKEQSSKNTETKSQVVKIGGFLKEIITVYDKSGNILHKAINPLKLEFRWRDLMQMMVGASLLTVPVAFTEEVWNLGQKLPLKNVLGISLLSLIFIASFVYYNFYRSHFSGHKKEFIKRVLSIYLVSLIVVGVFLTLIQKTPWSADWILAVKRIILIAFPASMSAAVADMIK